MIKRFWSWLTGLFTGTSETVWDNLGDVAADGTETSADIFFDDSGD